MEDIKTMNCLVNKIQVLRNYTIGIKEHTAFPEINPDEAPETFGLEITIVSTVKNNKEGKILLEMLGFPLRKK